MRKPQKIDFVKPSPSNPLPSPPKAYFSYDAHKSGGVTVSHLRFGPHSIAAPWLVDMAHYVGVHQAAYWSK